MICSHVKLTQQRVIELLKYDHDSGEFTWRESGETAGCYAPTGYILIGVDGDLYLAHRLAWFYVHGHWPKNQLDHVDQRKNNNCLSNLREATASQNAANTKIRCTNKSGHKGISWDKKNNKWRATITVDRKQISLGRHNSIEAAFMAYKKAAQEIYGAFAATELGVVFVDLEPKQ